ncbi:MAG TPA: type VI secretion system baseplate subunit TssF, partial [Polyangia bacterium]|nr:type VI secretion system baseplate subunit TssF [Polyangia bacterium]
ETRSVARPLLDDEGHSSVVRGIEVTIHLHDGAVGAAGGAALLGGVVQRFLAGLATLNTFVELVVTGTASKEKIKWPMIVGTRRSL